MDGELYYQGYNVAGYNKRLSTRARYKFEEVTYLLLFGSSSRQMNNSRDFLHILVRLTRTCQVHLSEM